jgi:hypothetical protein
LGDLDFREIFLAMGERLNGDHLRSRGGFWAGAISANSSMNSRS